MNDPFLIGFFLLLILLLTLHLYDWHINRKLRKKRKEIDKIKNTRQPKATKRTIEL